MGHLGGLLRPLGAVLGDLEASWWRLRPFGPRLGALGEGGEAVGGHGPGIPRRRMADPPYKSLREKGKAKAIRRYKGKAKG